MPQSARNNPRVPQEDKDTNVRAQEQEFKRARGAISCAECRRLKLKCDKTVPCSSCKRRGCSSICPNGSLTTGQGTRFILADTDRLHRKIAEMSDRIRQLEDALAILQSTLTRDQHPLLSRELLQIKSSLELHSATNNTIPELEGEQPQEDTAEYVNAFGTLAVRDDGAATFYGHSAGSESLLLEENRDTPPTSAHRPSHERGTGNHALPPTLTRLAASFPAAPSDVPVSDMQALVEEYLPPWPRAEQLSQLYLEQAPWFFGAVTRRQLLEEVLPQYYHEARGAHATGNESAMSSSTTSFGLKTQTSSHELALLFVIFCFGALTDSALPPAPHNGEAERYYQLTRAALTLEPVLDRPPSVATVQTLSLMAIYQGLVADENSIELTWALMGLSSKLAQSIGLHRDCARWKLSPAEVQKRRALFWELFITDCWQSLATGRLPTFSLQFVDAELAADPDETLSADGTPQSSFPAWKARFGKQCVAPVVHGTLTARAPKYSVILELDRKIRDMPLPEYAQGPPPLGAGLGQTMSHFMPTNYRELTLLYVHRGFFAQALNDHPTDPLRSQYAPSFLAGYRSACALIASVREQFMLFPVQIARFWVLWTHAFSSAVMLASVVTHGTNSKTAQAALGELRMAYDLFDQAAHYGGRAVKFLPIVKRLHEKAYQSFTSCFHPRKDIFSQGASDADRHDELSIFSGRTRTVETRSYRERRRPRSVSRRRIAPNASTSVLTPPDSSSGRDSQSPTTGPVDSGTPPYMQTLEPYGNSVHPALVDQMRTFPGELDAQIHQANAYYMSYDQQQQEQHAQQQEQLNHLQQQQQTHELYEMPQYEISHQSNEEWYSVGGQHPQEEMPVYVSQQAGDVALHETQGPILVPSGSVHASHSLPMYGAVDMVQSGSSEYHEYPSGADTAVYQYAHEQAPVQQHPDSELWSTVHAYPPPPETVHVYHAPPLAHVEFTPAVAQYQYPVETHQYENHAQPQTVSHPPPILHAGHLDPGGYSLQETWSSFMQQALPVPVATRQ